MEFHFQGIHLENKDRCGLVYGKTVKVGSPFDNCKAVRMTCAGDWRYTEGEKGVCIKLINDT